MAFESGGFNLGTAYAKVVLDSTGLDTGINSAKDKIGGLAGAGLGLGKGLMNVGRTATRAGLMIASPFLLLGTIGVKSAMESEAATTQLNAVLKSTGGIAGVTAEQALVIASSLQDLTTYSDEATLSAENLLLTFTNISKDVFPQATLTALDMSTALGQDLKSSSIQLGKALQDPVDGITALRRVGVNFTDEQKNMIEAMVASGDVMGAQKLILKELQLEFGGSAFAAGQTFGGQVAILTNKLDNVAETIGVALIPALSSLLVNAQPVIDAVANWIQLNPDLVGQIALIIGGVLIAGPIITALGAVITIVSGAVGILTGAITFLLSPVGLLILGITGIIIAANELYPGGIAKLFIDAAATATMLAVIFRAVLGAAVQWIKDRFVELLNTILDVIGRINELKNTITGGLGAYSGAASNLGAALNAGATPGQFFDALGRAIAGRDIGGAGMAGSPYLIGKGAQPEMFIPDTNGTFIPNADRLMGGGDTYNVTIAANSYAEGQAAGQGFTDEIMQFKRARG